MLKYFGITFHYQGNNFCDKLGVTLIFADNTNNSECIVCLRGGGKPNQLQIKPNVKKIHTIPKPETITTENKRRLKASNDFGVVII